MRAWVDNIWLVIHKFCISQAAVVPRLTPAGPGAQHHDASDVDSEVLITKLKRAVNLNSLHKQA